MYLRVEAIDRDGVKLFEVTVPLPEASDLAGLAERPLDVYCRVIDEPWPWPGSRGTIAGFRTLGNLTDPEPPRTGCKYGGQL